ncbi:hypothetical protein AVEN_227508-1 [Araneus ventricosus]|uniref:Uncharacterized protein n=1 Tax=Araneus ventricosus TaxID=182803 RepID=A0A4Y2C5T6_ARAVE|nr:hypothetical protein AVEN_227508-1 [Araneus ventricosus]
MSGITFSAGGRAVHFFFIGESGCFHIIFCLLNFCLVIMDSRFMSKFVVFRVVEYQFLKAIPWTENNTFRRLLLKWDKYGQQLTDEPPNYHFGSDIRFIARKKKSSMHVIRSAPNM